MSEPERESVRVAMDQAWRDHHHTRDQTWHALQAVLVLAAGLVGVDVQFDAVAPTLAAGLLTMLGAVFGIAITLRHRDVEVRKLTHVMHCEEWLGLHRGELISGVSIPWPIRLRDAFDPRRNNTSLFIVRLHLVVFVFAVLFVVVRCLAAAREGWASVGAL